MFNISWQDLASETVAQHRERKERDERTSVQSSRGSSSRSTESSDSSKTPNRPSPEFTSGGSSNHPTTPKRGISLLKNFTLPLVGKSPVSDATDTSSESQQTIRENNGISPDNLIRRNRGSVAETLRSASISQGRSNATGSSWSSITDNNTSISYEIQPIAESSYIIRSREITTTPQDVADPVTEPYNDASVSVEPPLSDDFTITIDSEIFQFPRVPTHPRPTEPKCSTTLNSEPERSMPTGVPKSGKVWKPPAEWECLTDGPDKLQLGDKSSVELPTQLGHDGTPTTPTRFTHQRRDILRMQAKSPKLMMERLKEEPAGIGDDECKGLEFNKHLWMRTALSYLARSAIYESGAVEQQKMEAAVVRKKVSGQNRILSLFESQASATFLAACTDAAEVCHVSSDSILSCPIRHAPYQVAPACSTIHHYPLFAPNAITSLPFEPESFFSIDSCNLPTLLPSASLPFLIRYCYRILCSTGTLDLIILDPMPRQVNLGPRMRTWIDTRLNVNLEKNFRCMTPSRLIPVWLKEAGFTFSITVINIWANGEGKSIDAELSTHVGRMLWKESWKQFLLGSNYWWEDEGVMEECSRMDTKWECYLLVAVKK